MHQHSRITNYKFVSVDTTSNGSYLTDPLLACNIQRELEA